MSVVLDASAILAILFDEPGSELALGFTRGAHLSTVNLVEILAKSATRAITAQDAEAQTARLGVTIADFSQNQARIAADIMPHTRTLGLSLADRACLALALDRNLPVLTADRAWASLDIGVDIRVIR